MKNVLPLQPKERHVSVKNYLIATTFLLLSMCFANTIFATDNPYNTKPTRVTSSIDCAPPVNLAAIQPRQSGLWSSPSTWPGNRLPTANDDITIPAGRTVTLVGTCRAKSIRVNGTLNAVNTQNTGAWINLETQSIVVSGKMEIGTESRPYAANEKCLITLTGKRSGGTSASNGGILVLNGGVLELHGKKKMSWTNLAATANAGARQITLTKAVDWEVGDRIALTATGLASSQSKAWNNVDEAEITAISGNGRTLTLKDALRFRHIGGSKTYTRAKDGKKWNVNIQAEVGLLSHYIKIQGNTSNADGFGGHIMMMKGSVSHSENIELYRMGQKGVLGRYPYHWHLNEDRSKGSYLRNSSVHKSFNRAVTIHGTDYVTVDGVFAYDHIGHGIFFEDGGERFNTVKNNVVFVTRRPSNADRLTPSDNEFNQLQNRTPASFWITNPNNYFENNVAAGTEGTGFWFAFPENGPMLDSKNIPYYKGMVIWKQPLGKFDGFVAHTCMNGWDVFDRLNDNHSLRANWGWDVDTPQYIRGGLMYGNDQAIYSGLGVGGVNKNTVFYDCAFSDNKTVTMLAGDLTIENSLFNVDTDLGVFNGTREFYRFYDGPGRHYDCHFEGWNRSNAELIKQIEGGGATENFNPTFRGTTKGFSEPFRFKFAPIVDEDDSAGRKAGQCFKDVDGSMLGTPGTLIRDYAFLRDGSEYRDPSWTRAAKVDYFFAGLWLNRVQGTGANIAVQRTKPGTPNACLYNAAATSTIKIPMIVNEGFTYNYYFDRAPNSKTINAIWYRGSDGDLGLACFKGFAKLGGIKVSGKKLNSKAQIEASKETAYFIDQNDVYVMFKSRDGDDRIAVNISWSNNGSFNAPNLPCRSNDFRPGTTTNPPPVGNNTPPSVSFKSPSNNQFNVGDDLNVEVNAADTDGSIANVRLFLNDALVRQENGAPYEWGAANPGANDTALLNLTSGTYVLRAVATDNGGKTATVTKTITVGAVAPPPVTTAISFQSPSNTQFNVGANLSVDVSVDTGSVANIRLYMNDAFVRQENITPYEWGANDAALQNLVAGTYVLKAIATPTSGNPITITKTITVGAVAPPPTPTPTPPATGCVVSELKFDFNRTDEGFTRQNIAAHNTTSATYWLLRADKSNDPFIVKNDLSFQGSQAPIFRVRAKSEARGVFQLFWATTDQPGFAQARSVTVTPKAINVYEELIFDISGFNTWMGKTVTAIRLDFPPDVAANRHTFIDYIYGTSNGSCDNGGSSSNGNAIVHIRKRNTSNFALDGGNGGAPNQDIKLWQANPNNVNQQWIEIDRGNGYYSYQKRNTNYCMGGGIGGANAQNVKLWNCENNNQNQQWRKVKISGNIYRLEKRNASRFSIDGNNGGANGQSAYLWESSNSNQNQHWIFEIVGSGPAAKESEVLNQLKFYPNPVKDILSISGITSDIQVEVYDMLGSLKIRKQLNSGTNTIDFSQFASGVYLVRTLDLKDPSQPMKTIQIVK